jgi:hypothetical protein
VRSRKLLQEMGGFGGFKPTHSPLRVPNRSPYWSRGSSKASLSDEAASKKLRELEKQRKHALEIKRLRVWAREQAKARAKQDDHEV